MSYSATTSYPTRVEAYQPRSPQRANTPPTDTTSPRGGDGQISPRSVSFGNSKREEEKDKPVMCIIPTSTAVVERGFSTINLLCSP
ncbi:hypothetical protein DPMN_094082 [Dreissena polymorpha]|uniref:Uncharacterized protein n=1 Tax=Dreissena polymorpha TaxID=45954 RepID=A0A9D4L451_DREPO|nr:hypothetical protein DPMN_094082 [Dreissena polymorpha]